MNVYSLGGWDNVLLTTINLCCAGSNVSLLYLLTFHCRTERFDWISIEGIRDFYFLICCSCFGYVTFYILYPFVGLDFTKFFVFFLLLYFRYITLYILYSFVYALYFKFYVILHITYYVYGFLYFNFTHHKPDTLISFSQNTFFSSRIIAVRI